MVIGMKYWTMMWKWWCMQHFFPLLRYQWHLILTSNFTESVTLSSSEYDVKDIQDKTNTFKNRHQSISPLSWYDNFFVRVLNFFLKLLILQFYECFIVLYCSFKIWTAMVMTLYLALIKWECQISEGYLWWSNNLVQKGRIGTQLHISL